MNKTIMTLEEKVSEKVGAELIDLIGEDKWKELIKSCVDNFTTNKAPKIIEEMLVSNLKERVILTIQNELQPKYDSMVGGLANDFLVDVMKKSGPQMLSNMFQFEIQNAINNLNTPRY